MHLLIKSTYQGVEKASTKWRILQAAVIDIDWNHTCRNCDEDGDDGDDDDDGGDDDDDDDDDGYDIASVGGVKKSNLDVRWHVAENGEKTIKEGLKEKISSDIRYHSYHIIVSC